MNDLISTAIVAIEEYLQGLDSCTGVPDLKLDGYRNGLQVAIQELKELSDVDVVPVVRCKDCTYYNTACCADGFGWCERNGNGHPATDNFYCANGEQKNED